MNLQTRDLVLFALGCQGNPPRRYGLPMEDGVHLRWGFRSELGFPLGGFDLYRRPHRSGDPVGIPFPQDPPGTPHSSPWKVPTVQKPEAIITSDQQLTWHNGIRLDKGNWVRITFVELVREVHVRLATSTPVDISAYHGPVIVGQAQAVGTGQPEELVITASAIESIEFGRAAGVIRSISYVPVSQGYLQDWTLINQHGPIGLPVTHPDYPVVHAHSPDDVAEAQSRVPPAFWDLFSQPPATPPNQPAPWRLLHRELSKLVDDLPVPMAARRWSQAGQSQPAPPPGSQEPSLEIYPLQQVLTASLDHNLARLLGLYWLDDAAVPGETYDYKIVGHWDEAGRKVCPTATWVDFSSLRIGASFGHQLTVEDIIIQSSHNLTVKEEVSPWQVDRALVTDAEFAAVTTRIDFPHPVQQVWVYFGALSGARLEAYKAGKLVGNMSTPNQMEILTVQANSIDYVEITGAELKLFGVCYLTPENAAGDRWWIVSGVGQQVPDPLPAPVGLCVEQVPSIPAVLHDGSLAEGANNLVIRWDLPVERGVVEPGRAVMYLVQRQALAQEDSPIDLNNYIEASPDPVLVTLPKVWTVVDEGTKDAPSEWEIKDGALQQRKKIRGVSTSADDLPGPGTYAVAGRLEWTDYQLTTILRTGDTGSTGVMVRYQDASNYLRVALDNERGLCILVKRHEGFYRVIAQSSPANFAKSQAYTLKVVVTGDHLQGWLTAPWGTETLFDLKDGDLLRGRVGLYCQNNPSAMFSFVSVASPTDDTMAFFEDDFQRSLLARFPAGWPTYPVYLFDQGLRYDAQGLPIGVQGLRDGWYAYRVAGVDIFGRISDYSQPFKKQAMDTTPPPPPMLLEAKVLQVRPADARISILDNMITSADQAWLAQNPAGGIRVDWLWTGGARRLAPDAAEFHIYFQPGRMNTIVGRVTSVVPVDPTKSKLTTDQTTSLPKDVLKDEWARVGVNAFKVISNESDTNNVLVLTVENLRDPKHSLDPAVPEWIAPVPAIFSVSLTPAMDGYVNFGDAGAWASRLQVISVDAMERPTGVITQIIPDPKNTYRLSTTAQLLDPTNQTAPGVLICGGQFFQATEHTIGQNIEITVSAVGDAPNPVVPGQGQSFVYYPSYKYEIIVPGLPKTLAPSEAEPVAYGQIGITAVDTNKNEGPVSLPYTVFAVKRKRPPAPPNPPPEPEKVFAEPADYYGQSRYTLSWPRDGDDAYLRYQVYRAVDSSLFAVDAKAGDHSKIGTQHPTPDYMEAAAWPFVVEEINKLDNGVLKYDQLRRDSLQVLASQKGTESAFTLITPQSLDPANPRFQGANNTMHFTDVLPGQATNCYFYRVAVVDRAGNRSDMAASSPPIYIPDTTPPGAPVFTRVLAGDPDHPNLSQDCRITLCWVSNREPDLAEYRVYRTSDTSWASDIRLMDLVKTVPASVGPTPPPEITWLDDTVKGLVTYSYRLVAIDNQGNVSAPSEIITARAYDTSLPEPPALVVNWVEKTGVIKAEIQWQSSHEVLLQRREPGGFWIDLTLWHPPGQEVVRDPFSEPGRSYEYRVRVRKYTGEIVLGPGVILASQIG